MCGIVGYIGKNKKAKDAVIKGLERLEYRGYDSSGIAYINDNEVVIQKEKGSNIYYIYTSPQTTTSTSKMTSKEENINTKNDVNQHQNWCYSTSKMNIEIDNINNIKIEKEVLLNEFKRMCRYDF